MGGQVKKLSLIIGIVGLLILVIGITFALYNIDLKGLREHFITTNKLTFSYKEPIESLNLISYNSLTDEEGKKQNTYYEFTVKGTSEAPEVIDYVIYLQKEEAERTFNESDLKVYLTKVENDVETEVVSPTLLSKFLEYNNISDTKALYGSSMNLTGNLDITDTYRLRIWLKEDFDFNSLKSSTTTNGEQNIKIEQYEYKFKVNVATGFMPEIKCDSMLVDNSGANAPELPTNAIAVCYNSANDVWLKADTTNTNSNYQWYSYSGKTWANAVTVTEANREEYLNAEVGTEISMDDINTMWVWIPRFTATGDTANYNGGTIDNPGAFDITFVSKTTTAHDAFTFGTDELNGFWVGKFETGIISSVTLECDNTLGTCDISNFLIKPDVGSFSIDSIEGSNNSFSLANTFYFGRSIGKSGNPYGFDNTKDITLDTHTIKNNECSAVAYLTQSIYGRCTSSTNCTEVYFNNSTGYTGRSGGNVGGSTPINETYPDQTSTDQYNAYGFYTYDGYLLEYNTNNKTTTKDMSKVASTTGNIYGVYDMSGGRFETVMGIYDDTTEYGFNINDVTNIDAKYYNSYDSSTNYTNANLQHALVETKGWYGDGGTMPNPYSPYIARGGSYAESASSSGIFYFYSSSRRYNPRIVLVK